MSKERENEEAKRIFEDWQKKREQIEKQAKEEGKWIDFGLDSNEHLFKEIDAEAKRKLERLKINVDV